MDPISLSHVALNVLAAILIVVGLAGAVVPMLPGIPLIFGGLWIIAAVDRYQHIGWGWLTTLAVIGGLALALDFAAAALGTKRSGASSLAVTGALIGTVVGLFAGLPGLLIGPFAGALIGELAAGRSLQRSAHVGIAATIGMVLGAVVKLTASIMMVVLFAVAWLWNRT
jgi:uncharacterized protein YqgC (DUF456 family)